MGVKATSRKIYPPTGEYLSQTSLKDLTECWCKEGIFDLFQRVVKIIVDDL